MALPHESFSLRWYPVCNVNSCVDLFVITALVRRFDLVSMGGEDGMWIFCLYRVGYLSTSFLTINMPIR